MHHNTKIPTTIVLLSMAMVSLVRIPYILLLHLVPASTIITIPDTLLPLLIIQHIPINTVDTLVMGLPLHLDQLCHAPHTVILPRLRSHLGPRLRLWFRLSLAQTNENLHAQIFLVVLWKIVLLN